MFLASDADNGHHMHTCAISLRLSEDTQARTILAAL